MSSTSRQNANYGDMSRSVQQQTIKRFLWLRGNFAYCLTISALIWIVAICYYIEHFIGWNSILALAPSDFAFLLMAVTLPLFALWFVLAYIERNSSLDANAQLFQSYIDSLMYPDDDATHNAKAFASVLQEQMLMLQNEHKAILAQSGQIKTELEGRIADLSDILKVLDTYSAKTLTELNEGIKNLADRCSYVTDRTNNSANRLRECSQDIAQNSDKFLSKLTPLLDELSALSSNIKNNISDNRNYLMTFKDQLGSCADLSQQYVKTMLAQARENTQKIERSFYKTAEEYDSLYKRLDSSISSIEGRVEEQKRLIQNQTQVINHNSDLIGNKLSKYGKTVSAELDKLVKNSVELEKMTKKQISVLKAVNSEASLSINHISSTFDDKKAEIERRCEHAVNSVQNVIVAVNKETDKLVSFANLTQLKNNDLQKISEAVVDKIGDISAKLVLKTDTLKDKAVEVIDKFTQASELISSNTEKLNTSSNLIVDNSKQGVKLLEEQNFFLTNAINNIDTINEKLNKLRLDISRTSTDFTQTITAYEKQIDLVSQLTKPNEKIEPAEPEIDREKLVTLTNGINRVLYNSGVNSEKLYAKQDIFALWDSYLNGQQSAFVDVLSHSLSHKSTLAIRKAFDDNAEFHNQVIRYLFLVDLIIKEMLNSSGTQRDELVNLSVNLSLDKVYFVLVKALNSAE